MSPEASAEKQGPGSSSRKKRYCETPGDKVSGCFDPELRVNREIFFRAFRFVLGGEK